jgi:hypothetical protein
VAHQAALQKAMKGAHSNGYLIFSVIIITIIKIIQFNSGSLMCQFYSQKANCRNSTTRIKTDNEQDTKQAQQKQTNKRIFKQLIRKLYDINENKVW